MLRPVLALFALLASSAGALAYCPPVLDDASSAYVLKGLQRSLCLQDDVGTALEQQNQLFTQRMQIQALEQQQLQQQLRFPPIEPVKLN